MFFGAILLIILISNFNDFEEPDLSALNEFRKNEQIKKNEIFRTELTATLETLKNKNSTLATELAEVERDIRRNKNILEKIENDTSKIKNSSINTRIEKKVSNIGGIKVDADYVVFIVDVSEV